VADSTLHPTEFGAVVGDAGFEIGVTIVAGAPIKD
jgi:hypothetical protein